MYYSSQANRRKAWYRFKFLKRSYVYAFLGLLFAVLLAFITVLVYYSMRAADYNLDEVVSPIQGSVLYDTHFTPIGRLDNRSQPLVVRKDIPPHFVNALLAREDEAFFEHDGIKYRSLVRSFWRNLKEMRVVQGGSTLTMQLARNVYELSDRSIDRKLLEMAIARRIESRFDKDTILTEYLNRIYYGCGCYGLSNAAAYYFGKPVRELSLVESACLAGLIRGPAIFNPVKSMKSAMTVKNETLTRMYELKMIDEPTYKQAMEAAIHLVLPAKRSQSNYYPRIFAEKELAKIEAASHDKNASIAVVTSVDALLQFQSEEALEACLQAASGQAAPPATWFQSLPEPTAEALKTRLTKLKLPHKTDKLEGAVLIVDARKSTRGSLLSFVGGRNVTLRTDFWQTSIQPGRAAAGLLFCSAYARSEETHYLVASDLHLTGQKLGYPLVRSFFESLNMLESLPEEAQADKLYEGLYLMRAWDLARAQFAILNAGSLYDFKLVSKIYSAQRKLLHEVENPAQKDFVRREAARLVQALPPFYSPPIKPTTLNVRLPEGQGQWAVSSQAGNVCVFVWLGAAEPIKDENLLKRLDVMAPLLANELRQNCLALFAKAKKEKAK